MGDTCAVRGGSAQRCSGAVGGIFFVRGGEGIDFRLWRNIYRGAYSAEGRGAFG